MADIFDKDVDSIDIDLSNSEQTSYEPLTFEEAKEMLRQMEAQRNIDIDAIIEAELSEQEKEGAIKIIAETGDADLTAYEDFLGSIELEGEAAEQVSRATNERFIDEARRKSLDLLEAGEYQYPELRNDDELMAELDEIYDSFNSDTSTEFSMLKSRRDYERKIAVNHLLERMNLIKLMGKEKFTEISTRAALAFHGYYWKDSSIMSKSPDVYRNEIEKNRREITKLETELLTKYRHILIDMEGRESPNALFLEKLQKENSRVQLLTGSKEGKAELVQMAEELSKMKNGIDLSKLTKREVRQITSIMNKINEYKEDIEADKKEMEKSINYLEAKKAKLKAIRKEIQVSKEYLKDPNALYRPKDLQKEAQKEDKYIEDTEREIEEASTRIEQQSRQEQLELQEQQEQQEMTQKEAEKQQKRAEHPEPTFFGGHYKSQTPAQVIAGFATAEIAAKAMKKEIDYLKSLPDSKYTQKNNKLIEAIEKACTEKNIPLYETAKAKIQQSQEVIPEEPTEKKAVSPETGELIADAPVKIATKEVLEYEIGRLTREAFIKNPNSLSPNVMKEIQAKAVEELQNQGYKIETSLSSKELDSVFLESGKSAQKIINEKVQDTPTVSSPEPVKEALFKVTSAKTIDSFSKNEIETLKGEVFSDAKASKALEVLEAQLRKDLQGDILKENPGKLQEVLDNYSEKSSEFLKQIGLQFEDLERVTPDLLKGDNFPKDIQDTVMDIERNAVKNTQRAATVVKGIEYGLANDLSVGDSSSVEFTSAPPEASDVYDGVNSHVYKIQLDTTLDDAGDSQKTSSYFKDDQKIDKEQFIKELSASSSGIKAGENTKPFESYKESQKQKENEGTER